MKLITCFFSPQSGFAYLGHDRLQRIARESDARIDWRPVDIAAVFAANDSVAPARQSAARLAYRRMDMARTARALDLELDPTPPFWPTNTDPACRFIEALKATGPDPADFIAAIHRALWGRGLDISRVETLSLLAEENGLSAEDLAMRASGDAAAAAVRANTNDAIALGVFGSPTYVVEGELFFGQDRLDMLAHRLTET